MSFASPWFLFALLAIPLLVVLSVAARRRRRRYAVRFPAVSTVAAVVPRRAGWRRHAPAVLLLAAVAALALALAQPQATVAVPRERATVMLVSDGSGSMQATDVEPSRLEASREAAYSFIDEVPEEVRVGFVGFAESAHTIEPPSTDRDTVRDAIGGLGADGGTATGEALDSALSLLREDVPKGRGRPPSAIVLLSDGESTTGRQPVPIARVAGRQKVPIYTIALGSEATTITLPGGAVVAVPPDPETMRAIARASNGEAFEATDSDALDRVYERLGSDIGTREEKREVSSAFAGGGALLLLLGGGLAVGRRGRLP